MNLELSLRLRNVALIVGLALPTMGGCPGRLEGDWPAPGSGGTGNAPGATGGMMMMGSGGTGGAGPAACDAETMYFRNTDFVHGCGAVGCHGAGSGVDLASPDPWSRLVGKPAATGDCRDQPLVVTSKPADGVLLKRLKDKACGQMMPLGAGTPDQPAVDCITSWVNSKLP